MDKKQWLVSTGLTALAIVVPVILYLSSLPENALTYQIISKTTLIGSFNSVDDIEIKIRGEAVDNATIYLFKIQNSGTEPIRPEDFERSIAIRFTDETRIFTAQVKRKMPENIAVTQNINDNAVLVEPVLMNPGDEFELEILCTSQEFPEFDSRIAGIKSATQLLPNEVIGHQKVTFFVLGFMLLAFYAKSFWHALTSGIAASSRIINLVLGLTCGIASADKIADLMDLDQNNFLEWSVLVIITITAIVIGVSLAKWDKIYKIAE